MSICDATSSEIAFPTLWSARTILHLTQLFKKLQRYEEAEALLRMELGRRQNIEESQHRQCGTLEITNELGTVCHALGKYDEAGELYKKSVEGFKARDAQYPHIVDVCLWSEVASTLHSLAVIYHSTGRNTEAISALDEAVSIRRKFFKPNHPILLESLNFLDSINPPVQPVDGPVTSPEQDAPVDGIREDTSAPDPGGDPTYTHSPSTTSPIILTARPQSPFALRNKFGHLPNSWGMF